MSEKIQFKTNINCGGCVAVVKPHLDQMDGIVNWEVDTSKPEKILTAEIDGITAAQLKEMIEMQGFKAESV